MVPITMSDANAVSTSRAGFSVARRSRHLGTEKRYPRSTAGGVPSRQPLPGFLNGQGCRGQTAIVCELYGTTCWRRREGIESAGYVEV